MYTKPVLLQGVDYIKQELMLGSIFPISGRHDVYQLLFYA